MTVTAAQANVRADVPESVIELLKGAPADGRPEGLPPSAPDEDTMVLDNDDFVTYEGLVKAAHEDGLRTVWTEAVQIQDDPADGPTVFRAMVATDRGVFFAYGDASEENTNSMTRNAIIRVAETRAKARALRDAVAAGTAAEELEEGASASDGAEVVRTDGSGGGGPGSPGDAPP